MSDTFAGVPARLEGTPSGALPAVVLLHGFLDDLSVWDGVVAALDGRLRTVRADFPGSGERTGDAGPFTLARFTSEVVEILDRLDGPVILVGQSMGAQVAEAAATRRPEKLSGLVLIAPMPFAGTGLPEEAVAQFKGLGGRAEAQHAARLQLSPNLTDEALAALDAASGKVSPAVAAAYVDLWNHGAADAESVTRFRGPVLVITGEADGFVTPGLLSAAIEPHFPAARFEPLEGAGHWLHVEQPADVAALIGEFAAGVGGDAAGQDWQAAFADKSAARFEKGLTPDVVLEASVLVSPIRGRAQVAAVMEEASGIYERLEFTGNATEGNVSYLQWRALAFGGREIFGVTILTRDEDGKISHAAIHHRPLTVALKFSAAMRDRLQGVVDASHFYEG
jgi:pimeloyl-ACP methyl ester carboxylesterase